MTLFRAEAIVWFLVTWDHEAKPADHQDSSIIDDLVLETRYPTPRPALTHSPQSLHHEEQIFPQVGFFLA